MNDCFDRHFHSYNESVKPPVVPGNSYTNYSSQPHQADPNWFKRFREENTKLDYVVCIRYVDKLQKYQKNYYYDQVESGHSEFFFLT